MPPRRHERSEWIPLAPCCCTSGRKLDLRAFFRRIGRSPGERCASSAWIPVQYSSKSGPLNKRSSYDQGFRFSYHQSFPFQKQEEGRRGEQPYVLPQRGTSDQRLVERTYGYNLHLSAESSLARQHLCSRPSTHLLVGVIPTAAVAGNRGHLVYLVSSSLSGEGTGRGTIVFIDTGQRVPQHLHDVVYQLQWYWMECVGGKTRRYDLFEGHYPMRSCNRSQQTVPSPRATGRQRIPYLDVQ